MTKSAMNNNMRTASVMTNTDIRLNARKRGYAFVKKVVCPACKEEMELAIQSVGYTGTVPAWVNVYCAGMFSKHGKPSVIACSCGYRGTEHKTVNKVEKRQCMTEGCNVILSKDDKFNTCYRCRTAVAKPVSPPIKTCNRNGCNNPVPEGRKAVCYDCLPPTKNANSNFAM